MVDALLLGRTGAIEEAGSVKGECDGGIRDRGLKIGVEICLVVPDGGGGLVSFVWWRRGGGTNTRCTVLCRAVLWHEDAPINDAMPRGHPPRPKIKRTNVPRGGANGTMILSIRC